MTVMVADKRSVILLNFQFMKCVSLICPPDVNFSLYIRSVYVIIFAKYGKKITPQGGGENLAYTRHHGFFLTQ